MQATQTAPVNSQIVLPFVQSVRAVLSSMAGVVTTVGKPYLKVDSHHKHNVSAIIGFSGDVIGSMVISLQSGTAVSIASAFAGVEVEAESPDFSDAIGELANMIAGGAKKDLGGRATITCPTVVMGEGLRTARLHGVPCIVIPCSTAAGEFVVEVNLRIGNGD
jgi:chemotaxis protein CheX